MSKGVYLNWIKWKLFIVPQYLWFPHLLDTEESVSIDRFIQSLTLYQILFPGGGDSVNSTPLYYLSQLRKKKVSIKHPSLSFLARLMKHMTYVHGQAELLLQNLRIRLVHPVTESTGHHSLLARQPVLMEKNGCSLLDVCTQEKEEKMGPGP